MPPASGIASILVVVVFALFAPEAQAEKRAFLVGVDKYTAGLASLQTANNDVASAAKTLGDLGFTIEVLKDPDRAEFDRRWAIFRASIKEGDVAAFYFGGHGLQVDGANYLLASDAPRDAPDAVVLEKAINFHQVMEELEARRPAATLYVLDACRNNPFAPLDPRKGKSTLGQTKGLARMESVFGAFIMYSAGPDEEALDASPASGRNSVYAHRLLPLMGAAELSLVDVAKRVQVEVEADARELGHGQRPAYFDGILGQYYLAQLEGPMAPDVAGRLASGNVIRLGGFATWDDNCHNKPAPRINVTKPPTAGRILTRYETVTIGGTHFGKVCEKSVMRGIGVYYLLDEQAAGSMGVDSISFKVSHWSVVPAASADEAFEIDLATRYSKRLTPTKQ
jgi:hypothetical protein